MEQIVDSAKGTSTSNSTTTEPPTNITDNMCTRVEPTALNKIIYENKTQNAPTCRNILTDDKRSQDKLSSTGQGTEQTLTLCIPHILLHLSNCDSVDGRPDVVHSIADSKRLRLEPNRTSVWRGGTRRVDVHVYRLGARLVVEVQQLRSNIHGIRRTCAKRPLQICITEILFS